ncbi:MAG: hypothetical protein RLZZ618_3680 [Pseudomonadota bacterium]|jgi:hypothetical protein
MRTWLALTTLCLLGALVHTVAHAQLGAMAMLDRHTALQERLRLNQFGKPLHIESTQTSSGLKGQVFAVVDHAYADVEQGLKTRQNWCDVLILHLNVKQCAAGGAGAAEKLSVHVGKKFDQPLSDAYRIDFDYELSSSTPKYLEVQLYAKEGPLGTRDYRIVLEAVPLDAKRTFIHMAYSYNYGMAARMAMQAYLSTIGSDKVGFSVLERKPDGQPVYVGSVRGVVERNTMRYYLAVEAYLGARSAPPAQQLGKRLKDWFAATERFARQLHEIEEAQYLEMKQKEVRRQQNL